MTHKYTLGDEVYHRCDSASFKVVGIKENQIEIYGDWSGGTHHTRGASWVNPEDVEPYDYSKVVYFDKSGNPYKKQLQ